MDLQKIDDIKKTITFLLENGEFADIETAYNISMNALNDIDELYKQDQDLQLQQTGVIRSSGNYCRSCNSKNISIDVSCEPNELICDDCWSLDISTENNS